MMLNDVMERMCGLSCADRSCALILYSISLKRPVIAWSPPPVVAPYRNFN